MASMLGRAALRGGLRSLSARRSGLLLAGRREASGSSQFKLGGTNGAIIAVGVGALGLSLYSVSVGVNKTLNKRLPHPFLYSLDGKIEG